MALEIILTSDGSHSLLNTDLQETYHSVHGAIRESLHVFIKNGLEFLTERSNPAVIHVLEVGFGTGLNVLLTFQQAQKDKAEIQYTTLEINSLQREIWSQLNFTDSRGQKNIFEKIHEVEWEKIQSIAPNFQLLKLQTTLQVVKLLPHSFDLIYFDAFAPKKQPEMWELPVLRKVVDAMKTDGVFVTYCAKGQLKRDLKSLGLEVQTLPGPPGKMEMVRGVKGRGHEGR